MTVATINESFPSYAKDIKINLRQILSADGAQGLTDQQRFGTALAVAYTLKHVSLIEAIKSEAGDLLSQDYVSAIKSAVSIMAMNNIYYRFVHLSSDKEYGSMPAQLRMMIIGNPGIDKIDFELFSLAISAINGCGMCIDSHAKHLNGAGLTKTAIQSAIRIAAVINAAATALDIEGI